MLKDLGNYILDLLNTAQKLASTRKPSLTCEKKSMNWLRPLSASLLKFGRYVKRKSTNVKS
jgi:hypothetical protein